MMPVEKISDPTIRDNVLQLVRALLVNTVELNTDEIERKGWVACPFEIISLMDSELAEQIDLLFNDKGQGKGVIAVEANPGVPSDCFRISGGPDALEEWAVENSWTNWILFPETLTAALLCTMENFNVVAGPRHVVEAILGMPLEEGYKRFQEFAERVPVPREAERIFLLKQARRYYGSKA